VTGTAALRSTVSATTRILAVATPDVGSTAGALVAEAVSAGTVRVLGVATGSSPLALYADLVALDEYVGLDADDPRSYTAYVREAIAGPLGVPDDRVLVPSGRTPEDALAFDGAIARLGGVDLQIVGIGRNGHIGFNEPGSDPGSSTRVVELAESTRRDNAAPFGGDPRDVPSHAITQGLGTILAARRIVLVASGASKAAALVAALTGPVTTDVPASFLQLHADVTVVADPAALGGTA